MKQTQAFTRIEAVLAAGPVASTFAVLDHQQPERNSVRKNAAIQQDSRRLHKTTDEMRHGDSLESVERRMASLGHIKELLRRGSLLTTVCLPPHPRGVRCRTLIRNDRLMWAWVSAAVLGPAGRPILLLRTLEGNSKDDDADATPGMDLP